LFFMQTMYLCVNVRVDECVCTQDNLGDCALSKKYTVAHNIE